MLRVTVEIVPYGREADKEVLEVLEIANTGENMRRDVGDYKIRRGPTVSDVGIKPWSRERVRDHVRDLGFWVLIRRVVREMGL